MSDHDETSFLVDKESDSLDAEMEPTFPSFSQSRHIEKRASPWISIGLLFCLMLSTITNFYLIFRTSLENADAFEAKHTSRYSGLDFDTQVSYHTQTDYWGENETLADELWEAIDTSPMVVALPYSEAYASGLSWSVPWVWDDEKGVYLIKAFHSMHCLKLVRKAIRDYAWGRPDPVHLYHVDHCLDSLRQDLMCKADDTPMPSIDEAHKTGDGQILQCRSWDRLVAWARHPDRHSCFNHINEYKDPAHKLEQFAFCPPDHPSFDVMTRYFDKFGHRDPFEE